MSHTNVTIHDLKIWTPFYVEIKEGRKHHELRKNDRNFICGDILHLREYDPERGSYTGYSLLVKVTYITYGPNFGLADGFCCMSIELLERKQ